MIAEDTLMERAWAAQKPLAKRYLHLPRQVLVRELSENCFFVCDAEGDPNGKEGYVISRRVLEREYEEL